MRTIYAKQLNCSTSSVVQITRKIVRHKSFFITFFRSGRSCSASFVRPSFLVSFVAKSEELVIHITSNLSRRVQRAAPGLHSYGFALTDDEDSSSASR